MDRNTISGLLIIVAIILTWSIFFAPKADDKPENTPTATNVDSSGNPLPTTTDPVPLKSRAQSGDPEKIELVKPVNMSDSAFAALSDSAKADLLDNQKAARYGDFYKLYEGESKNVKILTDKFKFEIPTKGAYMAPFFLTQFKPYDTLQGKNLPLVGRDKENTFSLILGHKKASKGYVDTKDLYFQNISGKTSHEIRGDQTKELVFRAAIDELHYIDFIYKIKGDSYDLGFDIRMVNMGDIVQVGSYDIQWKANLPKTEKAISLMRQKASLYYHYVGDDVESLNATAPTSEENIEGSLDWVAFRNQFFTQTLVTPEDKPFKSVKLSQRFPLNTNTEDPEQDSVVRHMEASIAVDYRGLQDETASFTMVNAPLDIDLLTSYERDMQYQVQLGWGPLKFINLYFIIPIFKWMEGFIGSYGLIIFLVALLIKMMLYPLTFKMYKSTAKMRIINQTDEIKELEAKHKDNATKLQQEKMAIYRKMGVSPLGGCLPMLLQYPFLISLFFLFPNAIELRGESFLWAEDLSTYDSIMELGFNIPFYGDHVSLFTLLMTVSIFVYTWINQKAQGTTQTGVMKYLPYFFPILFLGFLNNYSAGLSYYYFISNLISIAQTTLTKQFIDDKAILAQMKAGKKGGAKKGRLAKWAEAQQKKQEDIKKAKNNQSRRNRRN